MGSSHRKRGLEFLLVGVAFVSQPISLHLTSISCLLFPQINETFLFCYFHFISPFGKNMPCTLRFNLFIDILLIRNVKIAPGCYDIR